MFPTELEASALRTPGGEYAWTRGDALRAVRVLSGSACAVLGGEVWIVSGDKVSGLVPAASGTPSVFRWEADRQLEEPWPDFVQRSCALALEAIADLPRHGEVSVPSGAVVYYNVTWTEE